MSEPTNTPVWHCDASLWLHGSQLMAGSLLDCVQAWGRLDALERSEAYIQTAELIGGKRRLRAQDIASVVGTGGEQN